MGLYVSKYIEYRTSDGKWHLLESFIPQTDENREYTDHLPSVQTRDSGNLYQHTEHVEKLTHRNSFLYTGQGESPLENRGFPKNMSEELSRILDRFKDDVHVCGRSWFTLWELSEKYRADFEKFKSDFPAFYYESIMFSTNAKLDRLQNSIIALRNNTDIPAPADENEQPDDTRLSIRLNDFFEFNYEELVNEFALYQETYHLVANMQSCFPVDDVRIVYFVS